MVHAGLCVAVDEQGAVPLLGHVTDGNHNGHTAIAEQFDLLLQQLPPGRRLLVSDRGTFSAGHVARCRRRTSPSCARPPGKTTAVSMTNTVPDLQWQPASYLSLEQQRLRSCASTLPLEHYELAVRHHQLVDPDTAAEIPCRVIFVYSTADAQVCQATRTKAVAKIRAVLDELVRSVNDGRRNTDAASVARRVTRLFGRRRAAAYFHWELQALTAAAGRLADADAGMSPAEPSVRLPLG